TGRRWVESPSPEKSEPPVGTLKEWPVCSNLLQIHSSEMLSELCNSWKNEVWDAQGHDVSLAPERGEFRSERSLSLGSRPVATVLLLLTGRAGSHGFGGGKNLT